MFQNFAETLCENLSEHDYFMVSHENKAITDNTSFIVMARSMCPVVYTIAIINADILNEKNMLQISKKICSSMEDSLSQMRCSYAICVNLPVCSKNACMHKEFIDKNESPLGRTNPCWWLVDLESMSLIPGKSQPTKIMNLQNIIRSSFQSGVSTIDETKRLSVKSDSFTVSYSIIIINIVVCAYITITGSEEYFFGLFANDSTKVFAGEFYRLVTSMFFHSSVTHVGYNCLSIYIFGKSCEKYMGKLQYMAVYFMSGICGAIASCLFTKGMSVGASGGIFGVIGMLIAFNSELKKDIDGIGYFTMLIFAVFGILMGFFQNSSIDNAAHIAGFATGYLLEAIYIKFIGKKRKI